MAELSFILIEQEAFDQERHHTTEIQSFLSYRQSIPKNSREVFTTQRNPFKVRSGVKKESRGRSEDFSRKKTGK